MQLARISLDDQEIPHAVLERLRPELMSLPARRLRHVNLDVGSAVATVLGIVPRLQGLLPAMAQQLPCFDSSLVSKLSDCAVALFVAEAQYRATAPAPAKTRQALLPVARKHRLALLAVATSLAANGLLEAVVYSRVSNGNGYENLSNDLLCLTGLLRGAPPAVRKRCVYTSEELDDVQGLARDLLCDTAAAEHRATLKAVANLRARAFTLLMQTYDEVTRAVVFLRSPHGDAAKFAPSLHRTRRR